jgi:hypothetical protein
MSDATTHLLLPYILAAQAQKHVTHNEALRILDGLVQLSVLDRDLTAPPGSPADGDRYIVGSGATGDWAGWDLNVALWTDGAWLRLPPRTGWRAWVEDEGLLLVYDGAGWIGTTPACAAEPGAARARHDGGCVEPVLGQAERRALDGEDRGRGRHRRSVLHHEQGGGGRRSRADAADRLRDQGAGRALRLGPLPPRGLGRRQHLLRRAQRRQRHRHRRPAPAAALQGVHELRQLRRRRDLDEDRPQQHRLQRSGRLRRREQPLRGARSTAPTSSARRCSTRSTPAPRRGCAGGSC